MIGNAPHAKAELGHARTAAITSAYIAKSFATI